MEEKKEQRSILYVGTYIPRECGIATFTNDLIRAMDRKFNPVLKSEVLAMNDSGNNFYNYNEKVSLQIDEENIKDYLDAANEINSRENIKIVSIQHEFGIFGGNYGEYLIPFLDAIKKPVVITLHTVIPNPDEARREVTRSIINKASAVVVMASSAKKILNDDYGIHDSSKIFHIHHGVPQVPFSSKNAKKKINLENKIILSTFGLLSRGKGIEYVIKALPALVKKFPELIYLVIGETHPQVRKREGESYRNMLAKLVDDLGLKNNVRFYNKYQTLKEITTYLSATDIYIASSLDENQIVSGTLSYALGCGKAVIATPIAYAKEVLSEERGILVDFKNPQSIGKALNDILSNNKLREKLEKNAYELGRKVIWPNVAADYLRVFNKVTNLREDIIKKFPTIKLNHLVSL